MKPFLLTLLFFLAACGTIPQDKTPAPMDNNFYTAEISACGKTNLGLLGCNYNSTTDLEQRLEVPIFAAGEIQVKSDNCNYLTNEQNSDKDIFSASFKDLLQNKPPEVNVCDFDIKVFINGMDRGFHGIFSLVDLDDFEPAKGTLLSESFVGFGQAQVQEGNTKSLGIKFLNPNPGTIVWESCSHRSEREYFKDPVVLFSDLAGPLTTKEDSCIATIGIIPDDPTKPKQIFTFNFQVFTNKIVPLSDPELEFKDNKLKITSEKLTAAISTNHKTKIFGGDKLKKLTSKADQDEVITLRIATSNGRYNLYKVKNGEIIWKPLIVY